MDDNKKRIFRKVLNAESSIEKTIKGGLMTPPLENSIKQKILRRARSLVFSAAVVGTLLGLNPNTSLSEELKRDKTRIEAVIEGMKGKTWDQLDLAEKGMLMREVDTYSKDIVKEIKEVEGRVQKLLDDEQWEAAFKEVAAVEQIAGITGNQHLIDWVIKWHTAILEAIHYTRRLTVDKEIGFENNQTVVKMTIECTDFNQAEKMALLEFPEYYKKTCGKDFTGTLKPEVSYRIEKEDGKQVKIWILKYKVPHVLQFGSK